MNSTVFDLDAFCQDVDNLSSSVFFARRFTFSVPPVGSCILVIDDNNPAIVEITDVDGKNCTGIVKAILHTETLKVGDVIKGTYGKRVSEWVYTEDRNMVMVDDYRQCIIDMIKNANLPYRFLQLPLSLQINNASINIFLENILGEGKLKKTATVYAALNYTKKRGENFFFFAMVANAILLATGLFFHAGFPELLINVCATLYSIYSWHRDNVGQRRVQERFDKDWPKKKKEYYQLNDMIERYGLSPNRIRALHQWNMETRKLLWSNLTVDMLALSNAWCSRIRSAIDQLDMEDTPALQQIALDNIWVLIDEYISDFERFQQRTCKP